MQSPRTCVTEERVAEDQLHVQKIAALFAVLIQLLLLRLAQLHALADHAEEQALSLEIKPASGPFLVILKMELILETLLYAQEAVQLQEVVRWQLVQIAELLLMALLEPFFLVMELAQVLVVVKPELVMMVL